MGLLPGAKYGLCAWCKVRAVCLVQSTGCVLGAKFGLCTRCKARAVCVVKVDGVNNRTTTFVSIEMQGSGESLSLYLLYRIHFSQHPLARHYSYAPPVSGCCTYRSSPKNTLRCLFSILKGILSSKFFNPVWANNFVKILCGHGVRLLCNFACSLF